MSGYTLPVFACASAIAALRHLHQDDFGKTVAVNLIKPDRIVDIEIEQVAIIDCNTAIAITRSEPGDHLDITRNTPVWAKVSFNDDKSADTITIEGGEGIGIQQNNGDIPAIYSYARQLATENIRPLLNKQEKIKIAIILPQGKKLAKRTSNESFGVVKGLSLLGTTGIVQPLAAPAQLEAFQNQIIEKAKSFDSLVFCIGENGIDLAQKSGIDPQKIIKTANWLGSMLVTAGSTGIKSILLYGYHGKLIKLAGGIFHTHNHLADGRLEIITAYCAKLDLPHRDLQRIFACSTTEDALNILREIDLQQNSNSWVDNVYRELTQAIDSKSEAYVCKYTENKICVGSILFDRQRRTIVRSRNALFLLPELC